MCGKMYGFVISEQVVHIITTGLQIVIWGIVGYANNILGFRAKSLEMEYRVPYV